jgi:hypothetical protein
MSTFIWCVIGCALGLLALLGIGLCAAAGKPAPVPMPLALHKLYPWWLGGEKKPEPPLLMPRRKRVYDRGTCPYCGELDIPLRADGEPHRRFHRCESSRAPWPPAFVQTDEPQPPVTVTTWPPQNEAVVMSPSTTSKPALTSTTWPPAPPEV